MTVSIRTRAEADHLNPLLTTKGYATEIVSHIFTQLLIVDPVSLELKPTIVKSRPEIKVVEEGERKGWTTYTYEFLEEVTWDDGTPVTGEDYAFTMKIIHNPHSGRIVSLYRSVLGFIKDVEVDPVNPKKFTVYTDEPFMKAEYATGQFVYPKHIYDPEDILGNYKLTDLSNPENADRNEADEMLKKHGELFQSPDYSRSVDFVSNCGPYKLTEWVDGERIVLERKKDWWGDKIKDKDRASLLQANPKRLIFRAVPDAVAAMNLLKSGELDVLGKIPQDQFLEFKASETGQAQYQFFTPPIWAYFYYGMNNTNPKLADKRVRKAIAHLADLNTMIDKVMSGMAEPIFGPIHPNRSYHHPQLKPVPLNVDEAKRLLAEAGWTDTNNNGTVDKIIDGTLTEMELGLMITSNNTISSNLGLIFQEEAKKAGVQINLVEMEISAFRKSQRSKDFDLFAAGAQADPHADDPYQYWHSQGATNYGGFANAEVDQLIEDLRAEPDLEKRIPMYLRFQELLYEEQPVVFMYTTKDRLIIDKRFKNVEMTIVPPYYTVEKWTL
jgi:peptide/nickel transport system substrate-binding protein